MSNQPEDTNNVNPVPASEPSADVVAAKSNAENDIMAPPSDDSPAEVKPKKSFLPKFPFTFKGRNNIVRGGSNKPDGTITKTGGSSVKKPTPDPNLPKPK